MRALQLLAICAVISTAATALAASSYGSGNYSTEDALLGIYWANAVKCEPKKVLKWDCGPACRRGGHLSNITLVHQDSLEVRGFVAYDEARDWIVWSFRGTETILNWLEDFNYKLIPYASHQQECGSGCAVHDGFYTTYEYMATTLLPAYKELAAAHPNALTYITGHSLGAAQCQLALLDVLLLRGPGARVRLYDYGCPRVGNPDFANWAEAQIVANGAEVYRVVNDNDPVPMLPLASMGFQQFPRDFIWYAPDLPNPGWILCNDTGVQAEESSCGGSIRHANKTNHDFYLGIKMKCKL